MFYADLKHFKAKTGYEINGIWYPRVTSIVSIKAKPALYKFYADQGNFSMAESIKSKSADEGTLIHETIEAILTEKPVAVPHPIQPAINAFLEFKKKNEIVPMKIEERVVSKNHWYAGTVDVIGKLNGQLGILDIKTSYSIYRDYGLQTAAYVEAVKENNIFPTTRWVLRIDQAKECTKCGAKMREKGGNIKVRGGTVSCQHSFGETVGEIELKELDNFESDIKAFLACRNLWEWEHDFWIKKIKNGSSPI
ncbi:MAG: hypothetical protein A2913_02155 [Parcubacteria group bacterium RIFCSPLOWO2_01_FULL_40_65]|nr:MAG: hypothetical protein A2734_01640 [Parcubacteria group bacterium RIFCSPHIGHO2_01_FULL_40_30]OHB19150.1 MAG: hypothetical protein A3D40_01335 [Parcubacteria group bacterium RIFCSPHIGHO2_02_FULL_40_12]OHB21310.1 MAG: hypothetical protein A2913_02155 [Parcubacteria group bacterium RIFCSPLOWO2_01_FULL_40_65]OHB23177.1 MAG: hypothetical protein A3I22_02000 [Parcubacteria group bacterium RIFCSPLOWO2_02_FULL_40_12]OHB23770.1 MAG: hypothetical protein A3F96_01360 [Parcubacteria group bacterium R